MSKVREVEQTTSEEPEELQLFSGLVSPIKPEFFSLALCGSVENGTVDVGG